MLSKADLARELLEEFPNLANKTAAKMLYARHKAVFGSVEDARNAVRYVRNARGKKTISNPCDPAEPKPNREHMIPPSKSKPWEEFEIKEKCVLILSDCHVPYHVPDAIYAAINFAKQNHQLDAVLLNGDTFDCHSVGFWERNPNETDLLGEINAGRQFLLWLHYELELPVYIKKGNHEERLDRYYWQRAPELFGLPQVTLENLVGSTIDSEHKLQPVDEIQSMVWIGDQRPIQIGKLTVFHGHELPKGLTNAVNPGRGAYLRMQDTVLIGHHHRSSSHTEYNWRKEPTNCWSTGCLCDLTPQYARINKWNHGFAVVEVGKSGSFNVYNYKLIDNFEVVTA